MTWLLFIAGIILSLGAAVVQGWAFGNIVRAAGWDGPRCLLAWLATNALWMIGLLLVIGSVS